MPPKMTDMRYFFFLAIIFFGLPVLAQDDIATAEANARSGRPDIPGDLIIDYGLNFVPSQDFFQTWGSDNFSVYYYHKMRLGESNFVFAPGIGYSMDRYRMTDSTGQVLRIYNRPGQSVIYTDDNLNIEKSELVSHYVDIPVEMRFLTNPSDPRRSFKAAVGGKVGYLFKGMAKTVYQEDEQTKKLKEIERFHLTDLRYGIYLRVGTGGFNVYANYMLSPIFKDGEGPRTGPMNALSVGLSINGF